MLTGAEAKTKGIVKGSVPAGWRDSTYDATVGAIFQCGKEIAASTFTLTPRSIVWVMSAETFTMPRDVTALATLKTKWTHEGILALNVGVIDPGWDGPVSAAIVNFSNSDFTITKGDPFFRIIFHAHTVTPAATLSTTATAYKSATQQRSRLFVKTFLNMDQLADEVSEKVLRMPKWPLMLTILGLVLAILAVFAPIAFSVWTDFSANKAKLDFIDQRVKTLEDRTIPSSVAGSGGASLADKQAQPLNKCIKTRDGKATC